MGNFKNEHITSATINLIKDAIQVFISKNRYSFGEDFYAMQRSVPLKNFSLQLIYGALASISTRILILSLFLFCLKQPLVCQTDSLQISDIEMEEARDQPVSDTLITVENEPWQPDPKKALWFSLALPGLGQIYNGSWWKAPIIYGGLGVSVWFIRENNQNYKAFRTAYSESFNPETDNELVMRYPNQESLRRARDQYYKWYQLSIIATAAVYLMNGVEAYVDAHLKNFEISDNLSLRYGFPQNSKTGFSSSAMNTSTTFSIIGISYRLH